MRFDTLEQWLSWQERLHPSEIDLGLARIARVYQQLAVSSASYRVITVGGTNGKGSTVAMLQAILLAAGYRVGSYTSPHLLRYTERIKLNGQEVSEAALCQAFERVDQARGDVSLSYFEFGTLAALDIFNHTPLDVVVLEVGLGGRLDAVNIIDPEVALITNVDLDHQAWLGNDRESIAREKAGIMRADRPVVFGDTDLPCSLAEHAAELGAHLYALGRDYHFARGPDGWRWHCDNARREALPTPALRGEYQLQNAAGVLMALECVKSSLPVDQAAVRQGLLSAEVAGRFQVISTPVTQILDVAHNPHAARALRQNLQQMTCPGVRRAVVGMMADKEIAEVFLILSPVIDEWYLGGLALPRAATSAALHTQLEEAEIVAPSQQFEQVSQAYQAALAASGSADQLVVFGSFYTVAEVLAAMPAVDE